jgi:ABC-type branched-subunit amino acid transport system substrate-binding protein
MSPSRLAVFALSLLIGCHHATRQTLTPDVPQNGSATARARFQEARAKFLRDGKDSAEFNRIAEEFPNDPIVPWADLYAGIAAVKDRRWDDAQKPLQHVIDTKADPRLTLRARLFLGIAANYRGDVATALPLLRGADVAVETDDERTEYLAALAFASAGGDRPLQALAVFDQLWPRVSPTEHAAILARLETVVAGAAPEALRRAVDELADRKGPSLATAASRLALIADEAGNAGEAQRLRELAAPARAAVGLPKTISEAVAAASGGGDPSLIGAVVPLGGKQNPVAIDAVAGLGLAAGVSGGSGLAAIEVRTGVDAASAATAVEELAHANVIAIVGPIDGTSVDAAGGRAEGLGVPLLSLATRPEERTTGRFIFHMRHSAEARARALAERAIAGGITKFAVLSPESAYGKAVSAAFVAAVGKGGGKIVVTASYPNSTKSFSNIVGKLSGDWDAVFVPEVAEQLALFAPALAASGKVPKPLGTKKVAGGRPVLLLSTAEGLTAAYLSAAGRLSEGAWFAPGFYPDDEDATTKPFLDRFVTTYGRLPGATEAYAYDAAQLAAAGGAGGRGGLAAALGKSTLVGLTGTIRFDADHRRADPGIIYTIVDERGKTSATGAAPLNPFAIRVAK